MKLKRPMTFAALMLAAGLGLPTSAQVRSAGEQERGTKEQTPPATGGVRSAGGAQGGEKGEKKEGEQPATGGAQGRGEQRGGAQGGRGRQDETPPVPVVPPVNGGERPAQERPAGGEQRPVQQRPAGGEQRPPQQRPAGGAQERPAGGAQERPAGGAQERPGPKERPNAAKVLSAQEKVELMRLLTDEMNTHRTNMAKLKRLLALAREADDQDRIARVTALGESENTRHQNELERLQTAFGLDNFRVGLQRLNQGKDGERGNAGGTPPAERGNAGDEPGGKRGQKNDAGKDTGKDTGKGAGKDAGKDAGSGGGGGKGRGGEKPGGGR